MSRRIRARNRRGERIRANEENKPEQPIQNDIDAQEELLEERDAEEQLEHGAEIDRDMDEPEEDSTDSLR